MPVYEVWCPECNREEEYFSHVRTDEDPPCPGCGGWRQRRVSSFKVVFSGPLTARYNDPKREGAQMEGFWDYRVRSSVSGQPEPVFLETWDQLREFRKAEQLSMPGDVPANATISRDGRTISSAGMPGQWAGGMPSIPSRLQEMIDAKPEDCGSSASVVNRAELSPHGGVTGGPAPIEQMERIRPAEGVV